MTPICQHSPTSLTAWASTGIGGAFCAVSVPAIVRDEVSRQDAARLFGLIGLIMFIAPAATPSLGSLMLAFGEWQWTFLMLGASQFTIAGAISTLASISGDQTLLSIAIAMLACSTVAVLLALGAPRAVARAKRAAM